MDLWLSGFILFASLFLCSSAPTPEECNQLVKPLSLDDPSLIPGRKHLLAGYVNHKLSQVILWITDSSWVEFKASPSSNTEFIMTKMDKYGGLCHSSTGNVTLDGDTSRVSTPNVISTVHVLPSSDGCLVYSINSTVTNVKKLLKLMNINEDFAADEIQTRDLYLSCRESTLKDSDLEHFKKQANCLGFSGELNYRYNPEKSFCQEGEGIRLPLSQDSAPTPEECNQLVKPLSLDDPSLRLGRRHLLAGYTDHIVSKIQLWITESSWMEFKASPSSNTEVLMTKMEKFGGVCLGSTVSVTLDGDTAKVSIPDVNSTVHILPSCDGCLVFSINRTARNVKKFLKLMKINEDFAADEIQTQVLYLSCRESTLKDSDLEHFKKQANCLGFSGKSQYRYNPEKSFCQEGEGIRLPHSL